VANCLFCATGAAIAVATVDPKRSTLFIL